jgi:BirA family biotin operon repressor/biotin-[acetyl-CoA-carboxylase] ligase
MQTLAIKNPFNAPIFYEKTVSSTMDVSRDLEKRGAPHGTVIAAETQSAGRGRGSGRVWLSETGNLYFTVLLRYGGNIPKAITLKTGLAVARAIEDFVENSKNRVLEKPFMLVKWPNDIMINGKKIAGIIGEASGGTVFIGIGVNVNQTNFPDSLRDKAASLALVFDAPKSAIEGKEKKNCLILLEKILFYLSEEVSATNNAWTDRLSARLYRKGETIRFRAGGVDSSRVVEGVLCGINADGELLIQIEGEDSPEAFITGEFDAGIGL